MDEADKDRIRGMRRRGMNWTEIARQMVSTVERVRGAVDEEYCQRRRENRQRSYHALKDDEDVPEVTFNRAMSAETKRRAEQMLAELPRDTRGLTARLLGDPLPGRSALDMRAR